MPLSEIRNITNFITYCYQSQENVIQYFFLLCYKSNTITFIVTSLLFYMSLFNHPKTSFTLGSRLSNGNQNLVLY